MKTFTTKAKLAESLPWAEDYSPAAIKLIGSVEALGAIGVILPWLTDIAPVLTPIAAAGLAVIQLFAVFVHVRRHEIKVILFNIVLLLAAIFVAIFRFAAL
ncbi:DoxX family protein [Microbacterium sp. CH12i]|uniref:DoxX family protein n=1 Tax=Microbacterium sp. CH12i TaxID=1479651 RepID=UPI000AE745B9|nr:DoxX family protein [Microbacterium sp. CH12i]